MPAERPYWGKVDRSREPGAPKRNRGTKDPDRITRDAVVEAAVSSVVFGEPLTVRVRQELGFVLPQGVKVYRQLGGLKGIGRILKLSVARAENAFETLGYKVNAEGDVEYREPDPATPDWKLAMAAKVADDAAARVIPNVKMIIGDGGQGGRSQNQRARALLDKHRDELRRHFPGYAGSGDGDKAEDPGAGGPGVSAGGGGNGPDTGG